MFALSLCADPMLASPLWSCVEGRGQRRHVPRVCDGAPREFKTYDVTARIAHLSREPLLGALKRSAEAER